MQLNKCERCGCFFMSDACVCPNCLEKDASDINTLKNFLEDYNQASSLEDISHNTGISTKNLHRFFKSEELANMTFNVDDIINHKTEL